MPWRKVMDIRPFRLISIDVSILGVHPPPQQQYPRVEKAAKAETFHGLLIVTNANEAKHFQRVAAGGNPDVSIPRKKRSGAFQAGEKYGGEVGQPIICVSDLRAVCSVLLLLLLLYRRGNLRSRLGDLLKRLQTTKSRPCRMRAAVSKVVRKLMNRDVAW